MKQRSRLSHIPLRASLCVALLVLGCGGRGEAPSAPGDDLGSPPPVVPGTGAPSGVAPGTSQPTPPPVVGTPSTPPPTETGPVDPAPAPPRPPESATVPAEFLDLSAWKLTLPVETSHSGSPDEILQPELATFVLEPYFHLTPKKDGVVFRAPVEGATTSSSGYPRSELREMTADGKGLAAWSTTSGKHTMVIWQAITHLPAVKAHVVAGQIHDAADDVIMVRLEGTHLFVEGGGAELGTLNPNYTLGTLFTVKLEAADGHVKVYYNDVLKVDYAKAAEGCYFKAGMYTQSNLSKGDTPGSYGEAIVYDVKVTHE